MSGRDARAPAAPTFGADPKFVCRMIDVMRRYYAAERCVVVHPAVSANDLTGIVVLGLDAGGDLHVLDAEMAEHDEIPLRREQAAAWQARGLR